MILAISEILEKVSKEPDRQKKIALLRQNDSRAIRMLFQYAFDPRVVWLLPPGNPPYTPTNFQDQEGRLYKEIDKFFHFCKGGNDQLRQSKREQMFIQLLEGISPKDAELVCNVKDKKINYPTVTPQLVKDAYPDLDLVVQETQPEIVSETSVKVKKETRKPEENNDGLADFGQDKDLDKPKGKGGNKDWWNTPAGIARKEAMKKKAEEKKKSNG